MTHKTHLLTLLLGAAAAPAFGQSVLADWTFETSQPSTSGPILPETGTGSALGFHSAVSTYSSPAGNGSSHSFSSTNWSVGDYYQFETNATGASGLSLSFDQTSSNTGPKDFTLEYSTNGTTYTAVSGYSVLADASPNTPWSATAAVNAAYTETFDLSGIAALNNSATDYFRLVDADTVSANGGAVGTGGTDRVDNFTISAIPEPSTYALVAGCAALAATLWRRRSAGRVLA